MELNDLRIMIDSIDNELLELINKRLEIVDKIGETKKLNGTPIYIPEREKAIISRLHKLNNGKLSNETIEKIFLEIFSFSRSLEATEKIAFLGPEASFTHQAAKKHFGSTSEFINLCSIDAVFEEVARGTAKYGVIPIENSSNGIVNDTINAFDKYDLKIVGESMLDIHLCFASLSSDFNDIDKIYSKDIAFGQCRNFLKNSGLFNAEFIPVDSTVKGVDMALKNKRSAAICPELAAEKYSLPIIYKNIEDNKNNRTRFLIISDFQREPSDNDKTSILVRLSNEPGSLVEFLQDFEKNGINLSMIKSHIVGGESLFFIELKGNVLDKNVENAISKHKENVKVLGSYRREAEDI